MKFIVEIDDSTREGLKAINFLKSLKPVRNEVYIRKYSKDSIVPLSPEELALPYGKKPDKTQLRAYLNQPQETGADIETVRKRIVGSLTKSIKPSNAKNPHQAKR